ncbi:MAG TPA: hypothetical protein VLG50_04380 [Candidatus Saccharimonadales bacterium]|nr:hypothetical protein [Candidatus Saccharimonadales bacterium]
MKIIRLLLIVCYFSSMQLIGVDDTLSQNYSKSFFSSIFVSFETLVKKILIYQYPVAQPPNPVTVQKTLDICKQEKEFLNNRLLSVQRVLKNEFGIDKPLAIAFGCSGGGNRAMIGTLGLLSGAIRSKVFDASLYLAGVSGSVWTIAPLCYLAAKSANPDPLRILSDMKNDWSDVLSKDISHVGIYPPPLLPFDKDDDFLSEIAKRFAYDQPMSLIDIWGPIISHYSMELIGDNWMQVTWSSMVSEVQSGKIPLPLCASIYEIAPYHFEWFEISPFQSGCPRYGYIPTQYLGSGFKQNMLDSSQLRPEYPISFYIGMCGSGFSFTLQDLCNQTNCTSLQDLFEEEENEFIKPNIFTNFLLNNPVVKNYIENRIINILANRNQVTYAQFPQYSNEGSGTIGLFDAGIDFNFPIPLLVDRPQRPLDIVILYDSSSGDARSLHAITTYCRNKSLPVPDMSQVTPQQLNASIMSVFNDPRSNSYDKTTPTYIYFPTKDINVNIAPYTTLNFRYLPADIEFLANKMQQAFLSQLAAIKEIMQLVAVKRHA